MKFLKKIASKEEAVAQEYNVLYATDTEVLFKKALPIYTITFSDYDGSVILTKTYKQGETITIPPNPTREGFEFTVWSPTVVETAVANATYVAQYKEIIFDIMITYNVTDISAPTTLFVTYGSEAYLTEMSIDGGEYIATAATHQFNTVGNHNVYYKVNQNAVTRFNPPLFYEIDITKIVIGGNITSIGEGEFINCDTVTSVKILDGVTSIGSSAFQGCASLTSVTIGNSVTHIGGSAFSGCKGLTSVTIPDSLTSIGESAFGYCSGLTSVTIPDSVTSIDYQAFTDCTSLTSVTIGDSVTSIGNSAFGFCQKLETVLFGGTTSQWNAINRHVGWAEGSPVSIVHCTDGDISI